MTTLAAESTPMRFAAIDIGTNSIRCVVAEVDSDGSYRVLDEEREMTRLGHDLFQRGRLAAEPMERSYAALAKMKAIVDGFQVTELRAVATSAVREATNGRAFVREVRRRCGLHIEVISPEEEAQLALQSAMQSSDLAGRSVAVVDIGGGSVEVVLAAGAVVDQMYTLPLGSVRLTEAYGSADRMGRRKWKRLRRAIDRVLDERIGEPPFQPEVMIGSGGTFTNLADMVNAERAGDDRNTQGSTLTRADVVHLVHRLRGTPLDMRRSVPGLNPLRADIIVAGAAAVARLARRLGTQQIVVNPGGLRSGLLLSMIAEHAAPAGADPVRPKDRLESVRAFARKCQSGTRHTEHVAGLAAQLFDGLRAPFELPPEGRELLVAAALLHDVGYLINHARHHKHAYHLIQHAELQGWTAPGGGADRQRRALPPEGLAQEAPSELRPSGACRPPSGALAGGDPARGGRARPYPHPADQRSRGGSGAGTGAVRARRGDRPAGRALGHRAQSGAVREGLRRDADAGVDRGDGAGAASGTRTTRRPRRRCAWRQG